MAGLYIHIPFCKTRCIYCGFYSTTSLSIQDQYTDAICKEMEQRKQYLSDTKINTIYFGGGTPSQLTNKNLSRIIHHIYRTFNIEHDIEFTLESNPDDINENFIKQLKEFPINRISLGVQTFNDERLKFIRRRHNGAQAIKAVELLKRHEFNNISIDLMFGFPKQSIKEWDNDIKQAIDLDIQHISAYSLMFEKGTPLYSMLQEGKINEISEDESLKMYQLLIDKLNAAGFIQYEISNFCKVGFHSKHNSNYWNNTPYIGIGAAAHSFNGSSRQWNVDNIFQFIENINKGKSTFEIEQLTTEQKYNERVMTRLRTKEGINMDSLIKEFGEEYYNYCIKAATPYINGSKIFYDKENNRMKLTREGLFISNQIMSDLMSV